MKKAIKLVSVLVLLMSMEAVKATETSTFRIYAIGGKKINVVMQNIQGKAVSYIMDQNDEILFERKLKNEGELSATFDVSYLNAGYYYFVIEEKSKRLSVPFELTDEEVVVKMEESIRTNFPKIVKENSNVMIRLLSDESNDLDIEIKTQSGELLFKEKISGRLGLIRKRFEFTSGKYLITLISNHYTRTSYFKF